MIPLLPLLLLVAFQATQPAADPVRYADLFAQVLGEDRYLAEDARERFIQAYAREALAAVDQLGPLDFAAQTKLHDAFEQAHAEVRWRLVRHDLPPEDRALLDRFAETYPQLLRRLFHASTDERLAALERIPTVPNSGAAVVLVAMAEDGAPEVVERALKLAAAQGGPVIGRGLHRYLRKIQRLIDQGFFADKHPDIELVVGQYVHQAIRAVGAAEYAEATPVVLSLTAHFARRYDPNMWPIADVLEALGRMKDQRAVPLLLSMLREPVLLRHGRTADGRRITRTSADAALVALVRIFDREPDAYGLLAEQNGSFFGFESTDRREQGIAAFRAWYAARPQASQPAGGD